MQIIVRRRSEDYHAQIEGDRGRWDCGSTIAEAIGNLILSHKELFQIELKLPEGPAPIWFTSARRASRRGI